MAIELGENVFADWDTDGDLHLFTSENGEVDEASAEIWMNTATLSKLHQFVMRTMVYQRGTKVRLKEGVERYPHFIAEAGRTGIVAEHRVGNLLCVTMDEPLPGGEAWENQVCWGVDFGEYDTFATQLEVVP